jgi:GH15 family glucan-1,4-alpha-glucosidase
MWESICEYINTLNDKYDNKIDWLIKNGRKSVNNIEFIHPRFDAETLNENPDPWGNVQIDSLGYILLGLGLTDKETIHIKGSDKTIELILKVLDSIEYWHCPDNGIWEEDSEIHASSIGIVLDGLKSLGLESSSLYAEGEKALTQILPRESDSKDVDLSLAMIACLPTSTRTYLTRKQIVENITNELQRDNGAIRYNGDIYYNYGSEMEWSMWFPLVGIYHYYDGNKTLSRAYLNRCVDLHINNCRNGLPEGYCNGKANPNNPLGWSNALFIELIDLFVD